MPDATDQLLVLKAAGTLAASGSAVLDRIIVNESGDISNIEAVVGTAPTGTGRITVDIFKNGTSIFADAVAKVGKVGATAQSSSTGISSTDTTLVVDPVAAESTVPIPSGALLAIESEKVLVGTVYSASSGGGAGQGGSYGGGTGQEQVPITRAQLGTSAAAHAAGVDILGVGPVIAVTTTKSTAASIAGGSGRKVVNGDVLTLLVTAVGGTVAGADLEVSLTLTRD